MRVPVARPLDLLLFNAVADAYGARLGVGTDDGRVLHLCAEAGLPAVWSPADFAARERYRCPAGVKRVLPAGGRGSGPGCRGRPAAPPRR